jgi:DNA-binding response OmpR family regulator
MARLLVVEDDLDLSETLQDALRIDGFHVDAVADGRDALPALDATPYDVVVLDRDLPGMSGDAICRALVARRTPTRILMLTAAGALDDRVAGLDLGADDYLAKPFAYPELVARLRSLARRAESPAGLVVDHGAARLHSARRSLHVDGLPVTLTPKEFDVLETLLRAEGQYLSTERLLAAAWDEPLDRTHGAVRVVIHTLRRKVGPAITIGHVSGRGYRVEEAP